MINFIENSFKFVTALIDQNADEVVKVFQTSKNIENIFLLGML